MPMKDDKILITYGAGGRQTRNLIENVLLKYFKDPALRLLPDSASLSIFKSCADICFTTDAYVVKPIFFPGGDIGKLSICGTINDLAVSGAKPLFISCSLIIEEGFRISDFEKILMSMADTAMLNSVRIVTGDTKVVDSGNGDGIFITTSGIGIKKKGLSMGIDKIKPGDAVIISGVPGMHEISIVNARENLGFKSNLKSDCASVYGLVSKVLSSSNGVKFMRDPTRGGLASVLNEIVSNMRYGIRIYEEKIPVTKGVSSFCEILGFDILNLASEGRVVMIVDSDDCEKVVSIMRKHSHGRMSSIIGYVTDELPGKVVMKTKTGGERFILMPSGRQLPRIC